MKKSSIALILLFAFILLTVSGCISSDIMSSGNVSSDSTSPDEGEGNAG